MTLSHFCGEGRGNAESKRTEDQVIDLYDILLKNTDEGHPMTTGEIASALESSGIPATRKTI